MKRAKFLLDPWRVSSPSQETRRVDFGLLVASTVSIVPSVVRYPCVLQFPFASDLRAGAVPAPPDTWRAVRRALWQSSSCAPSTLPHHQASARTTPARRAQNPPPYPLRFSSDGPYTVRVADFSQSETDTPEAALSGPHVACVATEDMLLAPVRPHHQDSPAVRTGTAAADHYDQ